jgi:hypothetical protein
MLIVLDIVIAVSLVRKKRTNQALLPCSHIVFGGVAIGVVTLARTYIGNWHLQLVLPVFMGSIMLATTAFQTKVTSARILAMVMFALITSGLFGYARAFAYNGPAYRAYAEKVTEYMRALPKNPDQSKPFPETGGWDATVAMTNFLKKAGNPAFK